MTGENRITVQGLTKTFSLQSPRTDLFSEAKKFLVGRYPLVPLKALEDISFSVAAGQAVALTGHNGSGKSTLLRLLAGILKPGAGAVRINGKTAPLLGFGAAMQDLLSVEENIRVFAALNAVAAGPQYIEHILAETGLAGFRHANARELSSGMRVRIPFMTALHSGAEVFLIDEMLSAGDADFRAAAIARLAELKKAGAAIIFATHDPGQAAGLVDRLITLEHGRISYDGPPAAAPKA
ncbi:MAG TPA: ATP-binding cassette domain-containing protein [Elusimicrobiales bacterium]|nr:ATP-binding cassette domain-containing protein [Elusimicrobiales bacterium]